MKPVARSLDSCGCPAHPLGTTLALLGAPAVFVNGKPIVRLADFADCSSMRDVVSTGAATIVVGGLPLAGVSHRVIHGPTIETGSPDTNWGGPTFALPANLVVDGPADFRNKVLRDLWLLSRTHTGEELFRRLAAQPRLVTIQPREWMDFSVWEVAAIPASASNFTDLLGPNFFHPGRRVVYYDANSTDWVVEKEDPSTESGKSVATSPPQTGLAHELVHAVRTGEEKVDPQPGREEIFVRGDGMRYDDETINENRFREEFGLPRRVGYELGKTKQMPEGPTNLRPGGY